MKRLFDVEVRRYLSRRLVRVVGGLAVLGIVIGCTVMFVRSHRLDPAGMRRLEQRAEAEREASVRECVAGEFGIPASAVPPGQSMEQVCGAIVGEPFVQDPAYHLVDLRGALAGVGPILITLSLLLGASFIGAEWHSGTMATLLTWEPRRLRVFGSKVAVAAAMAVMGALVLQVILSGGLIAVAAFRGTTAGTDATWVRGVVGLALRAAAVAGVGATVGAALASLGRNTAAALGIGFGYLAVLEPLIRGLRPRWGPWLVSNNLASFLDGSRSINPGFVSRSPGVAGVLVAIYAAALAAIALAVFSRRDVI
jgi:ABC-2 type transport system permease protein